MNTYYLTVIIIIAVIALIFIVIKLAFSILMFRENISKFSFDETQKKFESAVTEKGWKMPAVHDLKSIMEKNGKQGLLPVKVYEICKPDLAFALLSFDKARFVSSMLPCRVAIYEKADGFVYISRMRTSLMALLMSGLISRAMHKASGDVEDIIMNTMR
ncbi:MAG: hypothetical protein BWY70_00761 [Bacteroidetes bacterium ADurb.Bin408]|nr:MAG: hypothetical protein BWY70_00761 [Bacteroidetes bacterium ADurb.Bin408]